MKNKILYINQSEYKNIIQKINIDSNTFCVEIEGKNCKVISDYLTEASIKLQFPMISKGFDGYEDWIRDLSWIKEEKIVVAINHYNEFLCNDLDKKHIVIESFEDIVFPWWESEVCEHMVEGKPRSFMVYLIE